MASGHLERFELQRERMMQLLESAENKEKPRIEKIIRQDIPRAAIPPQVTIEKTPFAEQQEIARALDTYRKKMDPTFQGAFHEKKKKFSNPSKPKKRGRRKR